MRLRACALACALTMLGSFAASGLASAAPRHNHHLTIAAVPREIIAGEGVVIYGRLLGPDSGGQTIRLYHHLDGSGRGFALVGTRKTDSSGYYEFLRTEGIVYTNRDWFVRGPDGSHSRTVDERVQALVTINPLASSTTDTAHPVVVTGHVTPNHAFERVFLQKQDASGDDWSTVASGLIGPGSNYTITHRFRIPGAYSLRVLFRGDVRNVRSFSDTENLVVQQAQVRGLTINSSSPIVSEGGSTAISGVLDQPGTTTPEPNTVVQLWGRTADQPFVVLDDRTTGSDGGYSFSRTGLTQNTVYYVATMRLPHSPRRQTARLFEGVQDMVTMGSNTNSTPTGQTVTFSGTVLPDKAGHVIYLQKLGKDGDFHTVEIGFVRYNSTFRFQYTIGSPGTYTFRARITSDENNIGGVSSPVSVTATTPAASSLTGAS
jgi:hypothetical protein